MKKQILAALVGGLTLPVIGATPESGVVTIHETELSFTNGPIVGANITPFISDEIGLTCNYGVDCDQFALTVDVPDNLTEIFPSPILRLELTWDSPLGAPIDDYDFYAYNAEGQVVGSSEEMNTATNTREAISLPVANGVTEYRLDVMYFVALGSSFTGTVQLDLGPASEDADLDAFYQDHPPQSALGLFVPENYSGDEVEASNRQARTQGGGALPFFVLGLLFSFGLRRKSQ